MNIEAKIETPTTIRDRVVDAFGFNEPSALDLVDRSKFADEDAFLDAAVKAEMERRAPHTRTFAQVLNLMTSTGATLTHRPQSVPAVTLPRIALLHLNWEQLLKDTRQI